MNELSLFSGCGGGLLGSLLLGWRTIGYVEREHYRCLALAQRIKDGFLHDAPVYCGTVREFIDAGYAAEYSGVVDVLSAGFPCPPFSLAGKRLGENDPRNGWPETIDAIRIVRPRFCFLENVPGLITHAYFKTICGNLRECGYRIRCTVLGGIHVGAPHIRKRLWLLAYSDGIGIAPGIADSQGSQEGNATESNDGGKTLADAFHAGREEHERRSAIRPEHAVERGGPDADTLEGDGQAGPDGTGRQERPDIDRSRERPGLADAAETRLASGRCDESGQGQRTSGLPESERRSGEGNVSESDAIGCSRRAHDERQQETERRRIEEGAVPDSTERGRPERGSAQWDTGHADELREVVADAEGQQRRTGLRETGAQRDGREFGDCCEPVANASHAGLARPSTAGNAAGRTRIEWWDSERGLGRMVDGMADFLDKSETFIKGKVE